MTNIPTELLRTLVAVVDLRSFTKAAQGLGMTQPAVSAQIKRLQVLLGGELLDKSAPGVALTRKGEAVVQFTVDATGAVKDVRLVSASHPIFARASMRIVGDYRCQGQGHDVLVQVPFGYQLQ